MKKIIVTKEVASIIESAKKEGSVGRLVALVAEKDPIAVEEFLPVLEIGLHSLMHSLVIGYEVEKTPEENVREYYENLKDTENRLEEVGQCGSQFRQGWQSVEETLELLGIKIEGVNAVDED